MPRKHDLTARIFSRWTVEGFVERRGGERYWLCECVCGTKRAVSGHNLVSKASRSCGCLQKEMVSKIRWKHGMSSHPLYRIWQRMNRRCHVATDRDYRFYGLRGIKVCKRWRDNFGHFARDMAASYQKGLSIERKDVNGNYRPGNCRWATQAEQVCNTRRNIIIETPWGKINASHAADKIGVNRSVFMARLRRGWPPERLFSPKRYSRWD